MTINITDIVTEYGAYYQEKGQGVSNLYEVAMQEFVTKDIFSLMITRDTKWTAAKSQIDSLVQPFQKAFTPRSGSIEFEPISILQHHIKVDDSLYPDDVMPSWLGFLASNAKVRAQWPFIRWYLEKKFFPKIGEDMELNEIGIGSVATPTPGTAGAVKTSMNGVQTVLNGHISAGRTVPISMGTIPTDNVDFVIYMEDFVDQINKQYWRKDMQVHLSQDLERRYQRGHAKYYGKETNTVVGKGGTKQIEFSSISVNGLPSMNKKADGNACNRIFCTPKENAVLMMSEANPFQKLELQAFERQVKFLTDWYMGVGFILPEIVFCNDQE